MGPTTDLAWEDWNYSFSNGVMVYYATDLPPTIEIDWAKYEM